MGVTRYRGLETANIPDPEGLIDNILRRGTPHRAFLAELFMDDEVIDAIARRFELLPTGTTGEEEEYRRRMHVAVQRFCGYDYVQVGWPDVAPDSPTATAEDTAALAREGGRQFLDEHVGSIRTVEELSSFRWPQYPIERLEWYAANVPDDMVLIAYGGFGHLFEWLSALLGYESLCLALYDDRDLVRAVAEAVLAQSRSTLTTLLQFDRVRAVWASDDMGFKTQTMISPADLREFVLSGHRELARIAHEAGRPYLLHSCGQIAAVMGDLIDDVRIDAKHSFEDTIEDVRDAKARYGERVALLGGIDIDFLCRADEAAIRARVRDTLDRCMPGGGFCLGTGNSVANFVPLESFLAMIDEARLYA